MSDYSENEFHRIMSNPPNEIISDSLKGRLKVDSEKPSNMSLVIGEEEYDCSLEGFSFGESLSKVEAITLSLREDLVGRILSNKSFKLKSSIANAFIIEKNNEHQFSEEEKELLKKIFNLIIKVEELNKNKLGFFDSLNKYFYDNVNK